MANISARWNALAVVLALAALTGCQGLSTGKPAAQGTQTPLASALTAAPASISFSNVLVGTSQTQSDTLTNTGGSSLTISQAIVTGTGFSTTGLSLPLTLTPGQSTSFGVVFSPQSTGSTGGNVALVNDSATSPLNIALSGTTGAAETLTASPTSFTFGSLGVGGSQTLTETLKNSGDENLTISLITATGAGFSISSLSTPLTLVPGQSAAFSVIFAPQSAGSFSGSIVIASNASNPNLTIPLSGSTTVQVAGQLSVSPATIGVGNVTVGTSGTQTGTLSATGTSIAVSSVSVGSSEFVVSGLSFPVSIPAGQSVNFTVTFTPQTGGFASVNVSFASNASNSPSPATLTGTGVAAPVHSVSLAWTASTSPNVMGYNVYRRTGTSGSYAQINTVLDATTAYADTSVADGQTYFYETTAVNSSNEESAPSSPVQALIPPP